MDKNAIHVYRYPLPKANLDHLDSKMYAWLEQHGFKGSKSQGGMGRNYFANPPGSIALLTRRLVVNVIYSDNVLNVYITPQLLFPALTEVIRAVIVPYVLSNNGHVLIEEPQIYNFGNVMYFQLRDTIGVSRIQRVLGKLNGELAKFSAQPYLSNQTSGYLSPKVEILQVSLEPRVRKKLAREDELEVPEGVEYDIKRTIAVEQSIEKGWKVGGEISVGTNLVLDSAIKGTLERESRERWRAEETVESGLKLRGPGVYRVIDYEMWRTGFVEYVEGGVTRQLSFSFREGMISREIKRVQGQT